MTAKPFPLTKLQAHTLRQLPRDGSPVGGVPAYVPTGLRTDADNMLRRMSQHGLVAMWPFRGWCITEEGIQALDAWTGEP